MAANLAINGEEFKAQVLGSDTPVLVDFWATWCRPCLAIAPMVEELAGEYAGKAKVLKVDVDHESTLAGEYGVMSIPTLIVFKGGQEVERMTGAGSKNDIKALIDKHL